MFPNLSAELARRYMTIKSLSQETDIKYETLKLKMRGVTEFTRIEMQKIKNIRPTMHIKVSHESCRRFIRMDIS